MRYVRQKLVQVVIVLLATTFLSVFLMRQVKGADPAIAISGGLVSDPKALEEIRHKWSLDKPIVVQWGRWVKNMVKGDLGQSSAFNVSVGTLLKQRVPTTLYLMLYTQVLSLLIAIPLGVYAAYRPNRLFDRVSSSVAFGLLSVPNFVVAVVLVLFFSLRFHWFPAQSTRASRIRCFSRAATSLPRSRAGAAAGAGLGAGSPGDPGGDAAGGGTAAVISGGSCSGRTVPSVHKMSARSITLRSSRTLPGQA